MGKYEIKDAVMLKECMKQIALVASKYPDFVGRPYLDDIQDNLKEAIEFIQEMVELDESNPGVQKLDNSAANYELDKILGRHSVYFNYGKAETRERLRVLILQAERKARIDELESVNRNQHSPQHKFGRASWPVYYKNRLAELEKESE